MPPATAGVQSSVDVNRMASPVIPNAGWISQPHIWSFIWFGLSVAVILGFHVRVFGSAVPPAARFP